ncbi:MAG TPA: ABC transporter permease, partial [Marmoricola sp.]|nr:ABC transporter permease [Marmoricola sp.]
NFAHGALATVSAYLFYTLHVTHEMPWGPAAVIAVLVAGPVMGLAMEAISRRLQLFPLAMRVAATVGVLLAVASAATLIYGTTQVREVPVFLSSGSFDFGGTIVQWSDAITLIFGIVATTALWLVLRFARIGIAMRAVVDNRDLLDTAGVSPTMVQRSAWIIGATFAAASGVLFSTLLPLDPIQLTMLVVAAFGASAIGAFRNLPMTFVGGLLIGVLASLATRYITAPSLAGISPSMPFVALFVVLLVFPKSKLPRTQRSQLAMGPTWSAPPLMSVSVGAAALVLLALVPSFAGIHLTDWTSALAMMILFLSLTLLVRTSGQVSLCHMTFAAIGAAGFSHLAVDHHVPWLVALLAASLVAVPVGAVLAIPAIRLGGVYLALATFGLGILVEYMFYTQSYMFGATGSGLAEPRPHLSWVNLESDTGFYYVVLAFTLGCVILLVAINRSRLGRLLRGVSEAPVALQTSGAAINITRVLVFCISAFLAALGGALMAISQGIASTPSYPPIQSLTLLTVVAIIAVGAPWNSILAGALLVLVPSYFPSANVATYLQLIFGLSA